MHPDNPGRGHRNRRWVAAIVATLGVLASIATILGFVFPRDRTDPPSGSAATSSTPAPSAGTLSAQPSLSGSASGGPPSPGDSPGSGTSTEAGSTVYLDTLRPTGRGWSGTASTAQMAQTAYPHSFVADIARGGGCLDTQHQVSEYALPAGTTTFAATFGLDDDSQDDSTKVRVEVYATGGGPTHRLLWSHTIRYGEPVPVELDVHGVIRLAFELSFLSGTKQFAGCEEAHPVLGSARLLVA